MSEERSIDAQLKAAAQSPVFPYIVLVYINFPSGAVYVHNGVGTHSFGGNDYLGVGALGSIDPMEETTDVIPPSIKLTLSPVNDEILAAIRDDNPYGQEAYIYTCALDDDGQLDGTPDLWIRGRMVKRGIVDDENSAISLIIESSSSRLKRRNNKRYTLEDHQRDYPGDLFLEFLPYVQDAKIIWAGGRVRSGYRNYNEGLLPGNTPGPYYVMPRRY